MSQRVAIMIIVVMVVVMVMLPLVMCMILVVNVVGWLMGGVIPSETVTVVGWTAKVTGI